MSMYIVRIAEIICACDRLLAIDDAPGVRVGVSEPSRCVTRRDAMLHRLLQNRELSRDVDRACDGDDKPDHGREVNLARRVDKGEPDELVHCIALVGGW